MTIKDIKFEMVDSLIQIGDDPDNCLTRRKICCEWDSATKTIAKVDTAQAETCAIRTHITEWCHRESRNSIFSFFPYHSDYGLTTTPPELIIEGCEFNDMFYEFNSIIYVNTEAYITFKNNKVQRMSNCGSIIKNKALSPIVNTRTNLADFTEFVTHFNYLPTYPATDHACTGNTTTSNGLGDTICSKLEFRGNTFQHFNYHKHVGGTSIHHVEGRTNAGNGMERVATMIHFDDFSGPVYIMGNTFNDLRLKITSMDQY